MKKLIGIYNNISSEMKKRNLDSYSAGTSFFLILSLIPLLIMMASILPYTAVTKDFLVDSIIDLTPYFANDILIQLVDEAYAKTITTISISAIVTIWVGSLGMASLMKGLNNIHGVSEYRNYFHIKFLAILYTFAFVAIMLLMLVLMVFGRGLKAFLYRAMPRFYLTISPLSNLKFIVVIGIATLLFALIYTYIPNIKLKFTKQLPGAAFSATVWYLFSWFFSLYVNNINNYSLYGSLATPVVIMFWLYFCVYIFFVGAFLNQQVIM